MIDLRTKNLLIKGSKMITSMDVNCSSVKQLLTSIGIRPTEELVNQVISHFKNKKLDFTMRNLYLFLKSKSIVSNDHRKSKLAHNKINIIHYNIVNFDNFNSNMKSKGYSTFTQDFLVKVFGDITINITRNKSLISAITAYDKNQSVINIPDEILSEVTNDIEECNV